MATITAAVEQPSVSNGEGNQESVRAFADQYVEIAELPEEERRRTLMMIMEQELALPSAELRTLTQARLEALLLLDGRLLREKLDRITTSIEAVADALPGELAMRRVVMVHTLARAFSTADQERLNHLAPGVFGKRLANPAGSTEAAASGKRHWWQRAR